VLEAATGATTEEEEEALETGATTEAEEEALETGATTAELEAEELEAVKEVITAATLLLAGRVMVQGQSSMVKVVASVTVYVEEPWVIWVASGQYVV